MNIRRIFIKIAAFLAILGVSGSVIPVSHVFAAGSNTTFKPVADSYVSANAPDENHGGGKTLRVDGSPEVRTYLRFDVSGLQGPISGAKLRILANSSSSSGLTVKTVGSNSWDENSINWKNAPQTGDKIAESGKVSSGDWISMDVSSAVTGNGTITLAVTTSGDTAISLAAREEGSGSAPQLVVISGSAATPTTPAPTKTVTATKTATTTVVPTSTATPNPTQPPSSGDSLSFPIRAAFYYPWFPSAWTQKGVYPFTNYTPTAGYYDSGDAGVIKQHIKAMQYGNIQAGIASWWGQGHHTDGRIPAILSASAGSGFRWSLYYENESLGNPSASQITSDLTYIRDRYGKDPSYLRVNGKFVVFVYADGSDGCGMADRWKQGNTVGAYIVLKVFPGYGSCSSQPDSWHQYAPAVATDSQGSNSFTISPGFWLKGNAVRLGRDLNRWVGNVRSMATSGANWQLVTTFNEWGEGTIVESAKEWATSSGYGAYLDALHNNGTGPVTPPTPTPTTTTTPTKTATPTATPTTAPTQPPSGGDAVLIGAGDISICSSTTDDQTAELLKNNAGTVFTAGDNSNESGTATQYNNCFNPSWGQVKSRIRPAPGNHDYGTSGASGYYNYFGSAAGQAGKGYYSYNLGSWHVVVLNGNCSEVGGCGTGSAQEKWLRADLAANPAQCTLAYWHQPRFSSGTDHGNNADYQPFWQALYDAGAEIVMNGHSHHYERFAPQTPSGGSDPLKGVREFVVGTGGAISSIGGGVGTPKANSEVIGTKTPGVLKLTLRNGSYSWTFIPVAGKTFTDSGSDVCH